MGPNYFKVCGKVIGRKLEQNLSRLFGECYLLLCQVEKINLVLQYWTRAFKSKRSGRVFEGRFGIVCPKRGYRYR